MLGGIRANYFWVLFRGDEFKGFYNFNIGMGIRSV